MNGSLHELDALLAAALVGLPGSVSRGAGRLRAAWIAEDGRVLREMEVSGELQLLHLMARMNAAGFRLVRRGMAGRTRHAAVFLAPVSDSAGRSGNGRTGS